MTLPETEVLHAQAATALRLLPAPACEPPYDDERPVAPSLRLVPTGPAAVAPAAPSPTPPGVDATRLFAHALVQRVLEVCAGVRPLGQLQRETTPELYDEIAAVLVARPRATGTRPTRADVRSVHVQQQPGDVAEVCATVLRARRAGALALRLERRHGRWVCSALTGF